jgi:phosphotransferase system enzyme I (PtsI)
VETALAYDAGGIGLFRSEFIYMESLTYPSEEEQFEIYKEVVEKMRGRKVIIRTLDLGTDKQAAYFRPEKENNPALGYRAIRISLAQPGIFKTQLRALYRASVYGNLDILFPLIISVDEVHSIKNIINEVKKELDEEGKEYSPDIRLGIMIETPAAVMISDVLAREVDFFSIGTNDLEQYTLAIDRQNPNYENVVPPNHLAVLRMIKLVVDNAHSKGIKVCLCGEMGADLSLTEILLDMQLDSLSVAPPQILPVRRMIRSLNLSDRRQVHSNIQRVLHY